MGGDRDSGMYDSYYALIKEIKDVIDSVEAGDINFEEAIQKLKDYILY